MRLERIEISGFRGIKRLSLSFDELTTLIGENTWGKSSLLDALSLALPADGSLYQFQMTDFHVDYAISHPQTQHLQIVLCFKAQDKQEVNAGRYRRIKPTWCVNENNEHVIYYRLSASRDGHNITTKYAFLDSDGEAKQLHHSEKLAIELMTLHPVIRLRDSRRFPEPNHINGDNKNARIEKRINNTCRRLFAMPGHVNKGEVRSSLDSMHTLVEHYFAFRSVKKVTRENREMACSTPVPRQKKDCRSF